MKLRVVRARVTTTPEISERMQRVRQKDTSAEFAIRRELHALGLRYRVHVPLKYIPRRAADVCFTKAKVAVFVDGCFWHGCPTHATWPKNNAEFWRAKIEANRARDRDTDARVRGHGWEVVRVWEHEPPRQAAERIAEVVRVALPDSGRRDLATSRSSQAAFGSFDKGNAALRIELIARRPRFSAHAAPQSSSSDPQDSSPVVKGCPDARMVLVAFPALSDCSYRRGSRVMHISRQRALDRLPSNNDATQQMPRQHDAEPTVEIEVLGLLLPMLSGCFTIIRGTCRPCHSSGVATFTSAKPLACNAARMAFPDRRVDYTDVMSGQCTVTPPNSSTFQYTPHQLDDGDLHLNIPFVCGIRRARDL